MSEPIRFTVFGVPQPKGSAKAFVPRGWTRPVITSDNKGLRAWETLIRGEAQQHAGETFWATDPVTVTLAFFLPRPASLPKRITRCTKKPDVDKLARATLDALTGVLFHDDAQVVYLCATKHYASAAEAPRVVVTVDGV